MAYQPQSWPDVSRNPEDITKLYNTPLLGLDYEWSIKTMRPTILGLSDGKLSVSVPWEDGKPYLIELLKHNPKVKIVGHNVVGADMFVLEDEGIHVPLEQFEDTILRHWLVNMHLSKSSNKAALEEDAGEKRGRGFNNLWTMASLYTSLPNWKTCRGSEACDGPCPEHDVFGYNGVDSAAPVLAHEPLRKAALLRDVEKLYPMHRRLAYVLACMSRKGAYVDVPYVAQMRDDFERAKEELGKSFPFNPKSSPQIASYFKERGILLENTQEQTVREAVEEYEDSEEVDEETLETLDRLLEYKELGNGPDRWFAPLVWDEKGHDWKGFVDNAGYIHPHLGFYTSSARMMCSGPNLQNVAKRRVDRRNCSCGHKVDEHTAEVGCVKCECKAFEGENIGKKIRRAIIAPPDHYIVRADYSNAENRVYLYLAEYEAPKGDLHNWMVELMGLKPEDEFSIRNGGPRNASKSVTHASDYLEGLQLLTDTQLKSKKVAGEIKEGARLIYPDWKFERKTVTFTGVNLAKRAWGKASYENRRRALEVVCKYMGDGRAIGDWPKGAFPRVRDLQRRIMMQIESQRIVRPPHGYALLSYGFPEDRCKTAAAVWGSQPVAHVSKLALMKLWDEYEKGRPMWPFLQVHDEILAYVHSSVPPAQALGWLQEAMEVETLEMPGFICPTDGSYGLNWRDQKKVPKKEE